MLLIRREQMRVLEAALPPPSEHEIVARLAERSLVQYRAMGPDAALATARVIKARSLAHGLRDRRSVLHYADLAWMLGTHFDRDPLVPWAAAMLADRSADPRARIDALYGRAVDHQVAALGDDLEHLLDALARIFAHGTEIVARWPAHPIEACALERMLMGELAHTYPEKLRAVGDADVRRAIAVVSETARRWGLDGARAIGIFFVFGFLLGAPFDEDPQVPWARAILEGEGDGDTRAARLLQAGLETIEHELG